MLFFFFYVVRQCNRLALVLHIPDVMGMMLPTGTSPLGLSACYICSIKGVSVDFTTGIVQPV